MSNLRYFHPHLQKLFLGLTILLAFGDLWPQESREAVVRHFGLAFSGIEQSPFHLLPRKQLDHPKVGLALSGGGIRGIAQIGVRQVLEEEGIPVD